MKKWVFLLFFSISIQSVTCQSAFLKDLDWETIGRGLVQWNKETVEIEDCFVFAKEQEYSSYEISFKARSLHENVQIWSGFGFQDRENRYALGLRGGNNNDLYLCKYQTTGKDKLLALESLDFQPNAEEWYTLKTIFHNGHIKVYLNNEAKPRIVVEDLDFITGGNPVLGGGWVPTEFKSFQFRKLSPDEYEHFQGDSVKLSFLPSPIEKESLRKKQRAGYHSVSIKNLNDSRTEVPLDGQWLFKPEFEIKPDQKAFSTRLDDLDWHIMEVPSFWNPVRNWLHLQDSNLPHPGSGVSDNYREKEYDRCESYTFDYKATAAWYRHWIKLPEDWKGKVFQLHFDAVSKVTDVYVNGEYAGGHIGMFGEFSMDITDKLKPGKNLIAVNVKVRKYEKSKDADVHVARAVSVDINNDMLHSLPCGMFAGTEGGIWQPVKLIVSKPLLIDDIFAQAKMDEGIFEVSLSNKHSKSKIAAVEIELIDPASGMHFYKSPESQKVKIKAGGQVKTILKTGKIKPRLWSLEHPNLYKLIVSVYDKKRMLIDSTSIPIGFREFEIRGNQFYLNGFPYWLSGANHPPCGIAPNDERLANRFFELMRDANLVVTRSHGSPFTKAWMDAADQQGIGVSFEGSWPWMMIGDMPSDELLQIWKSEMLSLVKKYRNHPSLFMWTINNEMYFTMFYHNDPPEVRLKKWQFLSNVIKEVRKLSPGIPISADSGYSRLEEDFEQKLKPHGIDDGDIDDRHIYFNWYNRDFFQVYEGEWAERIYWSPGANPGRPFFSQEASTGYPNNDDGHFCRKYLFKHYVPQAWIGNWAYEDHDPAFGLQRHAFMTKELMEVVRRSSPESAGLSLFANLCWYQNVFDAKKIVPYPVHEQVKLAASPVLISAELFGRHFFSSTQFNPRICIVNNSTDSENIPPSTLKWEVLHNKKVLSSGVQKVQEIPHYERRWISIDVNLPEKLPIEKAYCQLNFKLESKGKLWTENQYNLLVANKEWMPRSSISPNTKIGVFDISGETYSLLDFLGIKYRKLKDLTEIRLLDLNLLIVANLDQMEEVPYNWEDVRRMAGNGIPVLLIHPGKHLPWLYPEKIASIYERKGRVVNMHIPEHPAFEGIVPEDLAWWQQIGRERPRACRRSFRLKNEEGIKQLCTYLRPHVYLSNPEEQLFEMSGSPLMEISEKQGRIIASEMELNRGIEDPVAAKILINLIVNLIEK